jgi:hypothetical protein
MSIPDFGRIKPRDGSTEIHKDYVYYSGHLQIVASEQTGLRVLRLRRPGPDPLKPDLPLNLQPGQTLRIPCAGGYAVRDVRRVVGSIVELKDPLNTHAIPGHQIRRIKGYSLAYIDMVVRDQIEKGKIKAFGGVFLDPPARGK